MSTTKAKPYSTTQTKPSIRDRISQLIIEKAVKTVKTNRPILRTTPGPAVPSEGRFPDEEEEPAPTAPLPSQEGTICIVGAGAAGLYAAMMLQDLGINFTILEAHPERFGGRMYTHRFDPAALTAPVNTPERYDYIDMGAMRYPHLEAHAPFFNLCNTVDIPDLLVPYYFSNPNTFTSYNDITVNPAAVDQSLDVFGVGANVGGFVPPNFLAGTGNPPTYPNDGSEWVNPVMAQFAGLQSDTTFPETWAKLSQYDPYSTRAFMGRTDPNPSPPNPDPLYPDYPPAVIEWLEMLNAGTGMWNGSFIESVLLATEFGDMSAAHSGGRQWNEADLGHSWSCVDGGSDRVIIAMLAYLSQNNQPIPGKTVTGITPSSDGQSMMVQVQGEAAPRQFSQVICTVPLSCLPSIDMTGCNLSFTQKTAIRSLNYDASTKVALKFNTRWWEDPTVMGEGKTIVGGVTSTDLPVRMVVYPSYGLDCPAGSVLPGVIIASYSWAQDAARLGALAANGNSGAEATLMDIVLGNLKTIHGVTDKQMGPVVDSKVEAWYNNPYTKGAFSMFGPSGRRRRRILSRIT